MLCQFTVKNYKSIRDEATFDMQAAAISEHNEKVIIGVDGEAIEHRGGFVIVRIGGEIDDTLAFTGYVLHSIKFEGTRSDGIRAEAVREELTRVYSGKDV